MLWQISLFSILTLPDSQLTKCNHFLVPDEVVDQHSLFSYHFVSIIIPTQLATYHFPYTPNIQQIVQLNSNRCRFTYDYKRYSCYRKFSHTVEQRQIWLSTGLVSEALNQSQWLLVPCGKAEKCRDRNLFVFCYSFSNFIALFKKQLDV